MQTTEPSNTVLSVPRTLHARCSASAQPATAESVMPSTGQPNTSTAQSSAGASAMLTSHMMSAVVRPRRMCGPVDR